MLQNDTNTYNLKTDHLPSQGASVALIDSWKNMLLEEFNKDYMQELKSFLLARYLAGKTIYPKKSQIFNALNTTSFESVKVVLLGQDPYHGPFQAHGLSFSVNKGIALPPSLKNIFQELKDDLGIENSQHGDLSTWAKQGVFLLNSTLTVERGKPGSHQNRGWERFTDVIIQKLNDEKNHLVFLLWGSYAARKGQFIDRSKHLVIATPHPSPFSAHRGFFGSRPFSKINSYLEQHHQKPIDWNTFS